MKRKVSGNAQALRPQTTLSRRVSFSLGAFTLLELVAVIAISATVNPGTAVSQTVTWDTSPYWSRVQGILGGFGPDQASTVGETFIAPAGTEVTLNDFTLFAESYYPLDGGIATLHLRAFVYEWSGPMTGHGGQAVGNLLFLSSSFTFSPPARPNGWAPLTESFGPGGLSLAPGGHYVMGFTLSTPSDYAASFGDIEVQNVPARNPYEPALPPGIDGNGGVVWFNNSNNFALLNTAMWDTWGDVGDLSFTAHLTVIPEPSSAALMTGGLVYVAARRWRARRRREILAEGA
ncbi:exported hypothetical protein [Verrucomicrobia bacterium]|nr:exported hypothetical protein [Verrucomicrobiota bacterium]